MGWCTLLPNVLSLHMFAFSMFREQRCKVADEFAIKSLYVEVRFWDILRVKRHITCPTQSDEGWGHQTIIFVPRSSQVFLRALWKTSTTPMQLACQEGLTESVYEHWMRRGRPSVSTPQIRWWFWNCWIFFQGFQGLVVGKGPFWTFWTSPSNMCSRFYPQ